MYTAARLVSTGRAAVFLRGELPQSKPDGFASSLWEGLSSASVLALSVTASPCHLSQRERPWHGGKVYN